MRIFGYDISFKRADTAADLVNRAIREKRAVIGPYGSDNADLANFIFTSAATASGARVNESSSLGISAVYASVRVLAESVSSLPLKLYRRDGRARQSSPDHPLYGVLHDMGNPIMTAMKMRELMMTHLALWGNSFSEIQMNGRGDVVAIWPIHPARVTVLMETMDGMPRLKFEVRTDGGNPLMLEQNQVLFISGLGEGFLGKSPIQLHREGLGISVSAERYGAKFFANDARPGTVLEHPGVLGDEGYERLRNQWMEMHQGSSNAYQLAILEEGMKMSGFGLPPGDAQFIETRKYQRSEIASIFRVPPHMIGDLERATFSNIEHQGIEFVVHSLRPWLVRIEQAINMQLLAPEERGEYFSQHIVDGLLRGDTQSRFDAYTKARNWGWMSANDVRELENQNPVEGGDIYLQPLNMVPAGMDMMSGDDVRAQTLAVNHREDVPHRSDGLPDISRIERRALPPRIGAAKALQPIYLDAFRRIVKRETAEIRNAVTTYLEGGDVQGFRAWLEDFAQEHASWMAPRLLPVFQSMADAMIQAANDEIGGDITADDLGEFVADYAEASANRHAGSSRGQLEALLDEEDPHEEISTRLDEWDETRPDKSARRERERSSNAMTKAAWAVAGITAIVWRTTGSSCPICQEMNGRSTLIHVPFLGEGADVGGLVTRGSVGHPPLHDGCDCYLSPEIVRGIQDAGAEHRAMPDLQYVFDQLIAHNGGLVHGQA